MFSALINRLDRTALVAWIIAGVMATYLALRLSLYDGLGGDEAEQVLFAQWFDWGYDTANPPLYTWLLIAAFSVFGKSAATVLGLKITVLGAVYAALYAVSRLTLGDQRRWDAGVAALSPFLLFFMAWYALFSYSHSLLNALFVILAYGVMVMLGRDERARWYVALGAVVALGMMSKYTFGLFMAALWIAALTLPDLRRQVLSPNMLIALGVALILMAPHGWWLWEHLENLKAATAYKLQVDEDAAYLTGVAAGFWNIARALFAFLSPYWILALLALPAFVFAPAPTTNRPMGSALLGRTFTLVLIMTAGLVLFAGVTQFRPNYLFFFVLFPLWVITRLPEETRPGKRRRVYAGLILAGGVLSLTALTGKALIDPDRCKKCQMHVDYEAVAASLRDLGFTGGTLYTTWYPYPLAGNLALYLNEARAVSGKFSFLRPPARPRAGQCLAVWSPAEQGGIHAHNVRNVVKRHFDARIPEDATVHRLSFPIQGSAEKRLLLDAYLVPGSGDCR